MKPNDLNTTDVGCLEDLQRLSPRPRHVAAGPLLEPSPAGAAAAGAATVGELLALTEGGSQAWVRYRGQPGSGAKPARCAIDLHGGLVGRSVLLLFEDGDRTRPIVVGVLRGQGGWPLAESPAQVEVDADGQRLTLDARRELLLRCGKASLLLRADGRIELRGEEITSQASGAHRIRGGSIQLN